MRDPKSQDLKGLSLMLNESDLITPFIDTVLWAVTTNCNLRCTYCAVSKPTYHGEDFDLKSIDEFVSDISAANVKLVQISGHGETTNVPNWYSICKILMDRSIDVCITSNFSKIFTGEEIDVLVMMTHITISIDTVDRDLLNKLRRKVDLKTILYNMSLISLRSMEIGRIPHYNWQCTLSDASVSGLTEWLKMGLFYGVKTFTLGNLIEHSDLPDSPKHVARLKKPDLLKACEKITEFNRLAAKAGVSLVIQPGIIEGINESLAISGENFQFKLEELNNIED